jgi:hypothetical protein
MPYLKFGKNNIKLGMYKDRYWVAHLTIEINYVATYCTISKELITKGRTNMCFTSIDYNTSKSNKGALYSLDY